MKSSTKTRTIRKFVGDYVDEEIKETMYTSDDGKCTSKNKRQIEDYENCQEKEKEVYHKTPIALEYTEWYFDFAYYLEDEAAKEDFETRFNRCDVTGEVPIKKWFIYSTEDGGDYYSEYNTIYLLTDILDDMNKDIKEINRITSK